MLPSSWISNGLFILMTGGDGTKSINKEKKSAFKHTTNQKLHFIAFVSSAIWLSSSPRWSPSATAATATKRRLHEGLKLFVLYCIYGLYIKLLHTGLTTLFPLHQPEPPSSNKWQLDSWLNKVQAQTKPLAPPRPEHHGGGESRSRCLTYLDLCDLRHSLTLSCGSSRPLPGPHRSGCTDLLPFRERSPSSGCSLQDQTLWGQQHPGAGSPQSGAQGRQRSLVVGVNE